MHNVILKTLLLCFFNTTLFGQNDSIRVVAMDTPVNQITTSQMKVDSFTFVIDSIQVDGIKYGHTIETKSLFKKSKSTLIISFFLKDGKMNFVNVVEPSTVKGVYKYCDFWFTNNKVIAQRCRSTRQIGIAMRVDGENANFYGYNESLTFDFLKNYVFILFYRVQNYR